MRRLILALAFLMCGLGFAQDSAEQKPEAAPTVMKKEQQGITRPSVIASAGYSNRPLDSFASAYSLELGLMVLPRLGITGFVNGIADSDSTSSVSSTWFESELGASIRYQLQGPFKTNGLFVAPNIAWIKWHSETANDDLPGLRVGMDFGYHVGIDYGKLFCDFGTGLGYYLKRPEIHFTNKSVTWDSPLLLSIFARIGVAL